MDNGIFNIIEVILAILIMFFVLVQNKNVSLNLSNMSGGAVSTKKRGSEKALQNITIVLAVLFVINSIILFLIGKAV